MKTINFDFAKSILVEDYKRNIVEKVADVDISILVNNVGPSTSSNGDFEKVSLQEHKEMINVGIMPATILTKLLMDKMINRGEGKRSGVIFVTDVLVNAPLAGTATYGACKIYMDFLSKALAHENRKN